MVRLVRIMFILQAAYLRMKPMPPPMPPPEVVVV
jgi:hypothetical protein